MKQKYFNYLKRRISGDEASWKLGEKIPSIAWTAGLLRVSKYECRKFYDELIQMGLIEKYHNRFYLINDRLDLDTKTIQQNLIMKSKINLKMIDLLNKNAMYDKKYIAYVLQNGSTLNVYFPLKRQKITTNIIEAKNDKVLRDIVKRNNIA